MHVYQINDVYQYLSVDLKSMDTQDPLKLMESDAMVDKLVDFLMHENLYADSTLLKGNKLMI